MSRFKPHCRRIVEILESPAHITVKQLEALFEDAEEAGIEHAAAWKIVLTHRTRNDPWRGIQALMDEIAR